MSRVAPMDEIPPDREEFGLIVHSEEGVALGLALMQSRYRGPARFVFKGIDAQAETCATLA